MEINQNVIRNVGTHQTHCCIKHGCKYAHQNCPVADGSIVQTYPCEECGHTKPWISTLVSVSEEVFHECKNLTRHHFIFDNTKYSLTIGQTIEFTTPSMKTSCKRMLQSISQDIELPPNCCIGILIQENYDD